MGDKERMDNKDNTIILYSSQSDTVIDALDRDGVCFSKREYVTKKYGETSTIFTSAYDWFVSQAEKYVSKPEGAEYPYWAFKDLCSVDQSSGNMILELRVPLDEALFFDMYDWNKILCLKYMGENEADEAAFKRLLSDYGIRSESDIMLTSFYPDLKHQILSSWSRLFRHHESIKTGDYSGVGSVQAGLWMIRKNWIVQRRCP